MWIRVIVAALLFAVLFWIYLELDLSLDVLRQHAPDPGKTIRVGKINMRQIDALCRVLIPRMTPPPNDVRRNLICHHYKRLVPAIFVVASLAGWCASIWLLAFQGGRGLRQESGPSFLASLLLAVVTGVICYLILVAPFNFLAGDTTHLERAAIFPLLGGVFLRVFFERVQDVLSAIFNLLTGKKKPDSRQNHVDGGRS